MAQSSGADLTVLLGPIFVAMDNFGSLPLFPIFDWAHFTLMTIALRDDAGAGAHTLSRNQPLVCWFCSMLSCFSGAIIVNFLLGQPLLAFFSNHVRIGLATIVWYLVFYSPKDLYYKLMTTLPAKVILAPLKEVIRARKVAKGVVQAADIYPEGYLIQIIIGTIQGTGSSMMRNVERLMRGIWEPSANELLKPSFVLKSCVLNGFLMVLQREGLLGSIPFSHLLLYITIVMSTIKISMLMFNLPDPFIVVENAVRPVLFGKLTTGEEETKNDDKRKKE